MNYIADVLNGSGPPARVPPPPPPGAGQVEIERDRLREIQARLPEAARPLEDAVNRIVGLQVAEASWTAFTYSLAVAYNEVEAYTLAELRHRAEDTVEIRDGVGASADAWEAAEHASAPRMV